MPILRDFERDLERQSPAKYGRWFAVDLHNHTPASFDYEGNKNSALADAISSIKAANVSIVMFTDHERLPEKAFTDAVAQGTGAVVLRGAELNVFVDAWSAPQEKVGKQMYFHLLVGFDPDADPDYWITKLYKECANEERSIGTAKVRGFTCSVEEICSSVAECGGIVIPAHLHGGAEAFKSRSVDDIYTDEQFLRLAGAHFSALEVTDIKTAGYFDGQHEETHKLEKTCIRSSDSHDTSKIGTRITFVEMERPSFSELRAALQLRFRVSLVAPPMPSSYVVGARIRGKFYPDFWTSLSPHSNALIGVKGSGKTSLLECLRFGLGAAVPVTRKEDVQSHLQAILGAAGRVEILVKRRDGAKVLVERVISDAGRYHVTFEDDRKIVVENPEAIGFPSYILGWHEIEQAATDPDIRQVYLDTIAGRESIRQLQERAAAATSRVQYLHGELVSRYTTYLALAEQISRLDDLRKGLQELTDGDLIALKESYEIAVRQRDSFIALRADIADLSQGVGDRTASLALSIGAESFSGNSPLAPLMAVAQSAVAEVEAERTRLVELHSAALARVSAALADQEPAVLKAFSAFAEEYSGQVAQLPPEKQRLLETHRQVMEDTRSLPRLEAELSTEHQTIEKLLGELIEQSNTVADSLDQQTELRVRKVEELNTQLEDFGVHLEVARLARRTMFDELAGRFAAGASIYSNLSTFASGIERHHRRLATAYDSLRKNLQKGFSLFLSSTEFTGYLGAYEGDDLKIAFNVGRPGEKYTPIDQLSAGQRCTAVFPLLLKLKEGPLILDQPEDNLDNRHIADAIAPALLSEKQTRQIAYTSHNANLVVLTDTEQIAVFESDGSKGRVVSRGYLCTPRSDVTKDVIAILDGGRRALELRYQKYGTST